MLHIVGLEGNFRAEKPPSVTNRIAASAKSSVRWLRLSTQISHELGTQRYYPKFRGSKNPDLDPRRPGTGRKAYIARAHTLEGSASQG